MWGCSDLLNCPAVVSKGTELDGQRCEHSLASLLALSQALLLNVPLWSQALLIPQVTDAGSISGDCFPVRASGPGLTSGLRMLLYPCDIIPKVCFTSCSMCLGSPADVGSD